MRCTRYPFAFLLLIASCDSANEPELLSRIDRVMLPHDYLTWRLTGRHTTDRGDASGTGWFNPAAGVYRADLLALATGHGDAERWDAALPIVSGAGKE